MNDYSDDYQDLTIACADCKGAFLWDAGEQQYYAKRDYQPPKRCPSCRAERKRKQEERGK